MNVSEPEEPDRSGTSDSREQTDALFAEIVAGWRAESEVPRWPDPDHDDEAQDQGAGATGAESDPGDEDHFEPPEPPPFPVLRPRTVGGLFVLGLGTLLLLAPGAIGLAATTGRVLGLLALAGGLAWLLMGLRDGPAPGSVGDDGARL